MQPRPPSASSTVGPAIGHPLSSRLQVDASSGPPAGPFRRSSDLHRRLVSASASGWVFLPTQAAPTTSSPRVARRPATARDKESSGAASASHMMPQRPRRPHTSRIRSSAGSSSSCSRGSLASKQTACVAGMSSAELARVIQEAAQRQVQQEKYIDPLLGRGVEQRIDSLLPQARATAAAASNWREQHRARALQARERGDYHVAIQHLEKLLELSPSPSDSVFFHLAVAYERVGRLGDSIATYQRAIECDPDNPFVYYNAGNIHMRMGKLGDAIDCYSRAIQHGRELSAQQQLAFYRQRGAAYRKNGEFERAAQDYAWMRQEVTASAQRRSVAGCSRADSSKAQANYPDRSSTATRAHSIDKRGGIVKPQPELVQPRSERSRPASGVASTTRYDYVTIAPDVSSSPADSEHATNPYDEWQNERVLEIAAKVPDLRSQDELHFLADCLHLRFPFCAALHHDVCLSLSAKVVSVELSPGAPVFCERDYGRGCVYFVCRGRIAVYVTRAVPLSERPSSNQEERDGDRERDAQPPPSWESSYLASRNDEDDTASVLSIQAAPHSWMQTQVRLCGFGVGTEFGHQGRHSSSPRSYSAISASNVTLLALSWSDVAKIEQAQRLQERAELSRFLRMTALFGAASSSEIDELSLRARPTKVVGSKVLCTEGQFVGGLLVVKEGELCQLSPSGLPLPPDLSIAFNLCGSLRGQPHEQERSALEFFTQLEHADAPLGFLELSRVFHGFLPGNFLSDRLAALRALTATAATSDPSPERAVPRVVARSIRRGEFVNASSAWIPFSRTGNGGRGVSCAKSALVSRSSSEVLFFSARDLSDALSPQTRLAVFREIQRMSSLLEELPCAMVSPTESELPFFLSDRRSSDLLEQARRDKVWERYKQRLMQELVEDSVQRRERRRCQSAR